VNRSEVKDPEPPILVGAGEESRGVVERARRGTASTHFFVLNDPLCRLRFMYFVALQTSGVQPLLMASTHFSF